VPFYFFYFFFKMLLKVKKKEIVSFTPLSSSVSSQFYVCA
jgi:hypothetical protein